MKLTACYDLEYSPPTYDAVSFMVAVEMDRIDRGFDEVEVRVLPGSHNGFRRDGLPPFRIEDRCAMRDEVVVPMAWLLPTCSGSLVAPDRRRPGGNVIGYEDSRYGFGHKILAARRNLQPFRVPADTPAVGAERPYVTITLRETGYWPTRNSNVAEWLKVAAALQRCGYTPIIVRDTERAHELLDDVENSPQASHDLIFRAALYAGAEMNLFVNNGPAWLCMFLGAPTLIVKMMSSDAPCSSEQFFVSHGLRPGSQWPNAKPRQRIGWVDDDCADILREFDKAML